METYLHSLSYTWPFYAGFALAYLLGSIPFGLIFSRLTGAGDPRHIGSGNIGATNVLRSGRKGVAAATLLADAGKGALAVALALSFGPTMGLMAALGAVVGHIFPLWLGFRGGKGVATALGAFLALSPPVGLIACGLWLMVALIFRYSSLAALTAMVAAPIAAWFLASPSLAKGMLMIGALVWLRHASNIRRLLRGEEGKIGTV